MIRASLCIVLTMPFMIHIVFCIFYVIIWDSREVSFERNKYIFIILLEG